MKGDLKVKIVKQGVDKKKTINIINSYAPTLDRGKNFQMKQRNSINNQKN